MKDRAVIWKAAIDTGFVSMLVAVVIVRLFLP